MANKFWIEVFHRQDVRPGLQDITDWTPEDVGKLVKFFDDENIPWAFGCGDRMPDQIEGFKEGREA